jgi:hypothetical protein
MRLPQTLRNSYPLAQEGTSLLCCIHSENNQQTKHHQKEENFHAPRIAWSLKSVLCKQFANAQQLRKAGFELFRIRVSFTNR